jgi:hypothetical protein
MEYMLFYWCMSVQVFKYYMFKQQRDILDTFHTKERFFLLQCKCIFVDVFFILQQRVAGVFGRYVLPNIKNPKLKI